LCPWINFKPDRNEAGVLDLQAPLLELVLLMSITALPEVVPKRSPLAEEWTTAVEISTRSFTAGQELKACRVPI
jgi:hypothetical protein